MAGFEINILMDIDRFEAAITDWNRETRYQTERASEAAANFIKDNLQELLSRYPHPYIEATPTLPFKGPPGMITGHLRDSIVVKKMLDDFWKVYPTAIYARIQEIGGWSGGSGDTFIPPRPYFRPTVEELDTAGPSGLEHIFMEHWRRAMIIAVAF